MKITFLGHAALRIRTGAHELLVDPFITGNPLAKDRIALDSLNPGFILLTHAHQDHVLDAEAVARRTGATIISNYEIVSHYQQMGLNGHPMNHGGANGDCSTCHQPNLTAWTCTACHSQSKMDEEHHEVSGYDRNCIKCHADGRGGD